jgi:hypothetical protein
MDLIQDLNRIIEEGPSYLRGMKENDRALAISLLQSSSFEGKPIAVILQEQNEISRGVLALRAKYETLAEDIESRYDRMRAGYLAQIYRQSEGRRLTNAQLDAELSQLTDTDLEFGRAAQAVRDLKNVTRFLDHFMNYLERSRSHVAVQMSVNERGSNE